MNDELQKTLNDLIHSTVDAAGAAKTFVMGELPDVLHQLLVWKLASTCISAVVSLCVFTACIWAICTIVKLIKAETPGCDSEGAFAIVFISVIVSMASALFAVHYVGEAIEIYLAPKVYLIEYAAELIKK
jgi:hypothetical protein